MFSNLLTLSTDTTLFPWANRTPLAGLRATIAIATRWMHWRLSVKVNNIQNNGPKRMLQAE